MAKTRQSSLEMYRSAAQIFTMAAAILLGLVWIITSVTGHHADTIQSILILATMVGGVIMGLLYVVHLSSKR